jgi:hypothetical protein
MSSHQVQSIVRAFCRAMKPPEADSIADIAEPIAELADNFLSARCGLEHIELPPTEDLTPLQNCHGFSNTPKARTYRSQCSPV